MNCSLWMIVLFLAFSYTGCSGGASSEIEYRGERIKLTKSYGDYDEYKNDPENIDPSETERVQRLVMSAPIDGTFKSLLDASKAIGQIAFPGYGSGGFNKQEQPDGSVLMGFSVEIPRAGKNRYFIFRGKDSEYKLIDDFILPDIPQVITGVVHRDNVLVFISSEGEEVLHRPYPSKG